MAAGVAGYVHKTDSLFAIVAAIRAVVQGQPWYSPRVQGEIQAWLQGPVAALTARERAVLRHVARGVSTREIAEALCITEGTVKQHVTHIYRKVKIKTRAAAVAWAWEHGVVKK
ncbi:MAG: response regulator transcription factor [Anaerolineae bacterium]|nr:response regulator transcription factor [Anaerolineae bacterium]